MLHNLHISNVVLIQSLDLDFNAGLCALTGETGAGKSILLDSLSLAMGARSEARLVRKGTDTATVTATFDVTNNTPLISQLHEQGIDVSQDPQNMMIRRSVKSDGKSKAWLNDQPISIGLLKSIAPYLVEYHGQFETHGLRDPERHAAMLDAYAQIEGDKEVLRDYWREWRKAERTLKHAEKQAEEAKAEEEYLRACLEDLDKLAPEQGEEDTLTEMRQRLKNKEEIISALSGAQKYLTSDKGADNALVQTTRALDRAQDKIGEVVETMMEQLDNALENVRDVTHTIDGLIADITDEDISQEALDDRLYALRSEARKHGCMVDDLANKREEISEKISLIEHQEDTLSELNRNVANLKKSYIDQAEKIRAIRVKFGEQLDTLIMEELKPLKLDKARFVTQIAPLDEKEWSAEGTDRIQFLVATNPGAEPGPLGKIASGGEMARFMLALKVVLAEVGDANTLVFDEVDAGIGGATADAVGERLARLAEHKQIMVVTHAPQVAAKASHHWIVAKGGDKDVTTNVIPLTEKHARQEEIARMLAGAEITSEARAAANKLLEGRAA